MALRSPRHRNRPIAALALDAGTTIGQRCATIHIGPEDECLQRQAGYTTATDSKGFGLLITRVTTGRRPYTACEGPKPKTVSAWAYHCAARRMLTRSRILIVSAVLLVLAGWQARTASQASAPIYTAKQARGHHIRA